MSFETPVAGTKVVSAARGNPLARLWSYEIGEKPLNMMFALFGALFFSYVYMAVKSIAMGIQVDHFGDFFALWSTSVATHEGHPALNYDPVALHAKQVEMGLNPHYQNPFPYPPTFLLFLGPLGAFSLAVAFWVFMIPSFALYMWAMVGGREKLPQWWMGAAIAPATGVTLISGQSGFLSGGLMLAGLRLAKDWPIASGVMFGLLTFKPQLGVLVPVALIAAGLWRTIASACATVVVCFVITSLVYGWDIWRIWLHSILDYAHDFDVVAGLMPTIEGNMEMLGAPRNVALIAQIFVSVPVTILVWRAFRGGVTPAGIALLTVATFLVTPHAFNYDMPMMTAAIIWYVDDRYRASRSLDVGELIAVLLATLLPFIMLHLRETHMPFSYAPLMMMLLLIARPFKAFSDKVRPLAEA